MSIESASPWPVVAAIDFGTHGTGYAWTEVIKDDPGAALRSPKYRDNWPGARRRQYPKNLTALLLDPQGEVSSWGHDAEQHWRDLATSGRHEGYTYVSDFKMALKPDSYQDMTPPGLGARRINSPQEAYPLVVEYLRRMYAVALEEISRSAYLEDQIRWCVTIPAIWDEPEKQLMRDAAIEAGLPKDPDRLLLAIEPEVAALYCRIHLARVLGSQDDQFDITADGRRFTVVDCGGGTVDITSYRVERSAAGDRPRLVQIALATGGKLGSEYINQAFIDRVLADRFGGPDVIDAIRDRHPHALGDLVDAWENHKVTATVEVGPHGEPVFARPAFLILPGEIRDMLSDDVREHLSGLPGGLNRLAVQPDECRDLFDTVAVNIVERVENQLRELVSRDGPSIGPERLLMVGGLSESAYLQLRLQHHLQERATLIAPKQPSAAVLCGAVHYGYDPSQIRSRMSGATYGCGVALTFRPGIDPPEKEVIDHAGRVLCTKRFQIFTRSGDSVDVEDTVDQSFGPIDASQTSINFVFYKTGSREPVYLDEPGAEAVGRLTVELGTAMELPVDQRRVRVMFRFGNTEIEVEAVNEHTGDQMACTLRFESSY